MNPRYSKRRVVRALHKIGVQPNKHLIGRKEIPAQVIYSYTRSVKISFRYFSRIYRMC